MEGEKAGPGGRATGQGRGAGPLLLPWPSMASLQQFQLGAGEERKTTGSGENVQKSGWLRGATKSTSNNGQRKHDNTRTN